MQVFGNFYFNKVPIVFCLVHIFRSYTKHPWFRNGCQLFDKIKRCLMLIVDVLACANIMTSDSPHATTYERILIIDKVRMDMSFHTLYLRLIEIKAKK